MRLARVSVAKATQSWDESNGECQLSGHFHYGNLFRYRRAIRLSTPGKRNADPRPDQAKSKHAIKVPTSSR